MENQKTKMTSKEKFIKWRNYQTCQEAIYIACLNEFCEITFLPPMKQSKVTKQYLRIKEIKYQNEQINIQNYLKQKCKKTYQEDIRKGTTQKTAKRRLQIYRKAEEIRFYHQILIENGYSFEFLEPEKVYPLKIRGVKTVIRDKLIILDQNSLEKYCNDIHKHLLSTTSCISESTILHQNDPLITNILLKYLF